MRSSMLTYWVLRVAVLVGSGAFLGGVREAPSGEMLPPEAAQALADMDFERLAKVLEANGMSGDALAACKAMAKAYAMACQRLNDGSWRPTAPELLGVPGEIKGVSAAGVSLSSSGVTVVMPWRSIPAAKRQAFLAAGAKADKELWLARVAYAAWSGLGALASEEASQAAKEGVELPGFLALALDMLSGAALVAPEEPPASKAGPEATKKGAKAKAPSGLLGSADFTPSPKRPVGWRGDWTGRYPGATPPVEWARIPKGIYSGIRVQASRPKGSAQSGAPLNMGSIRDWLVLGPFEVSDAKQALEEPLLRDEASVQPTAGDRVGQAEWKPLSVSVTNQSQSWARLVLDLAFAFDKSDKQEWQNHPGTLEPLLAYAHTYLYSPGDGKIRLRVEGQGALKVWFNGSPVKVPGQYEPSPEVNIKAGWNRLLVKCVSSKRAWHFSAHVSPAPPIEYETKNVIWMTPMPGRSWCSPIVVRDRIFVGADEGTLVCVSKLDGRILWMKSTTYYHVASDEDRAKFSELEPKVRQLESMTEQLVGEINAAVASGKPTDSSLRRKIEEKVKLEGAIRDAMGKADRKFLAWYNDAGWATPTPTSDGERVYAAFYGGNKGLGANVVTCFDLNGKRIWGYFCGQTGIEEHGNHCSPALCGDYLVYKTGQTIFGFEKKTGKVAWTAKAGGSIGPSVVPIRLGNVDAALVPQSGIYRASDGRLLWKADFHSGLSTPFLVGDVFGGVAEDYFYLYRLPQVASDTVKPETIVRKPWKDLELKLPGTFTNTIVASPLFADGLVYVVSEGGGLVVVDASTGKVVYTRALEELNPRLTWVFAVGLCSSPCLAGKYIFIRDDQAQTLVIESGRQYKQVAKNVLMELDESGNQPESQSNFFFDGDRIYFRSSGYLYCIGAR